MIVQHTSSWRRPLARVGSFFTAALALALVLTHAGTLGAGEPRTKVVLNGKPVPVYFNDGDTFRVLGGTFNTMNARLEGWNTLESYGPVHQWGDWTAKELYVLAKMATLHARRGVWTCEADGKRDTYGRLLAWCPDLAEEMVRLGYAHVLSIDDKPGRPELVEAQADAIAHRRGIWAHGVPAFVLTSLHSVEEDADGKGTYNRIVSTTDGHSGSWQHRDKYEECERVCHRVFTVDAARIDAVVSALANDAGAARWLGSHSPAALRALVTTFATYRVIDASVPKDQRFALSEYLGERYVEKGAFGDPIAREDSCMIHVPFKRRYGGARAECLQ